MSIILINNDCNIKLVRKGFSTLIIAVAMSSMILVSTIANNVQISEQISIKSSISNTNNGDFGKFKSNKFSFEYPSDWSVGVSQTTINDDSSTFIKLKKNNSEKIKILLYQSKDVYGVDSYGFMKVFESEESMNHDKYKIVYQNAETYQINNNPAHNVLVEYEGKDGSGKALDIFQITDDKIFVLRYYAPDSSFDKNKDTINDLLSTIKIYK